MPVATEKDISLEALRGLAAIAAVLFHCIAAFYPQCIEVGFDASLNPSISIRGQFWFVLVNGQGAVNLFFVLSAFVLTRKYFLTGNEELILRGAIKRWPRLAGPVLVSTVFSWLLFVTNAYSFGEASQLTHSKWIVAMSISESASLKDAVLEGLLTFFKGSASFNGALWTMRPEFIGSFIAFGLALVLFRLRHSIIAAATLLGIVALLCQQMEPLLLAFPFGVALALFLPTRAQGSISFPLAFAMMLISLYLLGYTGRNIGIYTVFGTSPFATRHYDEFMILGAGVLIATLELSPKIRRALGTNFMAWIGELSFPIYLVHIPIICSVGTASLMWLSSTGRATEAAVAISCGCSLVVAIPLLAFNRRWIILVNHIAGLLLSPKVSATSKELKSSQFAERSGSARAGMRGSADDCQCNL